MFSVLNKPYPRNNDFRFRIKIVLLSGISVSIVLLFILSFQTSSPFSSQLIFNVSLFGMVTILATSITNLLFPLLFKQFFSEEKWTVAKNIFMWLMMFVIIATGNMLLANYLYNSSISLMSFSTFLYYSVVVGFFVYAILNLLNYNRLVKKNSADAVVMNEEIKSHHPLMHNKRVPSETEIRIENTNSDLIKLTSENGKEELNLSSDSLIYIESADNYCKVITGKDAHLSVSIIRSSLKRIEEQVNHPEIFRCHRAFIVNLKKINCVSGNSQGYRLHFQNMDETIPVSRNSGKELLEKLKMLSYN